MSKSMACFGVAVVAAAVIIFLQYQTQQKLRAENDSLRQQIAQSQANIPETPADSKPASSEEFNELLRLRGEVSALRAQTNQIARLEQQNQQLQNSLTNAVQARQQSAAHAEEQRAETRAFSVLQMNTARASVLAMLMYASDHKDEFPTNFDLSQATNYLAGNDYATNLNAVELVYRGPLDNVANPASAIVVRSTQPWMSNGKWSKAYGFADGHSEIHSVPNGNFDEWEQQHAAVLKNQ